MAIWALIRPLMQSTKNSIGPPSLKNFINVSLGAFFASMKKIKKIKPSVQPTDIPPYALAKIGLDLSGP